MKTADTGYLVERVKLQTQPRYFARFFAIPTFGSATDFPFSRDFSSGGIAFATKTKLTYLMQISGVSQSISPELGQSTIGQFTLTFQDRGGELLKHLGQQVLTVRDPMTATSPADGEALNVVGSPAGFPSQGTVEVFTGGVSERIRYSSIDAVGNRFINILRHVDGTTAATHNPGDPVQNGEQIRPGTRVQLFCGYQGLAEADYMPYVKMLVMARQVASDGITITISVADIQRTTRQTIFLQATQNAPVILTGNPLTLGLQILTSTGTGLNGAYDVLPAVNGLKMPQVFVDVAGIETLRATEFPSDTYSYSIVDPQEGKKFFEKDLLQSLNCYPLVTQDGKLTIKRYKRYVPPGNIVATLTEQDIISWGWNAGDSNIINVVEFDYDFNQSVASPGEYALRQVYTKVASYNRYGAKPRLLIQSMGIRKANGAQTILDDRAFEVFRRFSEPPAQLSVECFYRNHCLEPGDQVQVTHPNILNINTGLRGLVGEVFEVVNMSPGFDAGRVTLQLLWVASILPITPPTSDGEIGLVPPDASTGQSWRLELSRVANTVFPAASVCLEGEDLTIYAFHRFDGATINPLRYDVSTDGGQTFPTMRATSFNPTNDIVSARTVRLASGTLRFVLLENTSQAIAYSDSILSAPSASTWTEVTPPGSVGSPLGMEVNGLNVVVMIQDGGSNLKLAYSTDGGTTFSASSTMPTDTVTTPLGYQVFAGPTAGVWCLLNPNSGKIYRSTDSGNNWGAAVKTITAGDIGLGAVSAIFAVNATRVVAVYKGQVSVSDDAGVTWTDQQNLTLVANSPLDIKQGGIGWIANVGLTGGATILSGATNYVMSFGSTVTRQAFWRSLDLGTTWTLVDVHGGGLITSATTTRLTAFAAKNGKGVVDIWNSGTTERKTWSSA
jgi:predicted RecA/RadA family phage recombinase